MSAPGFGKDPMNPSHGDSLVDQSFQSLKSKEVRDSISPTGDLKFHSMSLNHPNTTGWDVQTSSEVSPDGRAYRTETVAKTDGVEKINGGTAEFKGHNEQRASASQQGDDKNFVKKASESSNTHLQERVVLGDENSGRTEMKTSSTTTSSSSQVFSSSSTNEYDGTEPSNNRHIMNDSNRQQHDQRQQRIIQDQQHHHQQERQQHQDYAQNKHSSDHTTLKQHQQHQQQEHQQRQLQQQEQQQYTQEYNHNRQESNTSRNVETRQVQEQNRRVVDMDKASPEYQQHVQHLMTQPGEIISNTVEYPKPNVKMITTVKRLPDGTIVKNKRYETEELRPSLDSTHQHTTSSTTQSSTQQKSQRRQQNEENVYNREQNISDNTYSKNLPRPPTHDVVDNIEKLSHLRDNKHHVVESHPTNRYTDDTNSVETQFSSVKKSSRRFSTETTSETVEEYSDQSPNTNRGKPQDFSTHGFPSVKPNKPTQEYPSERPHAPQPSKDYSTHGFPSVKPNKPTQEYPSDRPRAVHSTEVENITQRSVTDSRKPNSDIPEKFPDVRPNMNVTTTKDGDVIIVSSEATRTSKFNTNAERVFETEVITDGDRTTTRPEKVIYSTAQSNIEHHSTRQGTPSRDYPSALQKPHPSEDFSTHGFPSVRSPDHSTQGYPSTREVVKPGSYQPNQAGHTVENNEVTVVSSETQKTIKHNTNREHIIKTEVIMDDGYNQASTFRQPDTITFPTTPQPSGDYTTHGFPSVRDTGLPRQGTPIRDYPSGPGRHYPTEDFSTHGFPSVKEKSPVKGGSPRYVTPSHEYPNTIGKSQPSHDYSTQGYPSAKSPTKTTPDYSSRGSPVKPMHGPSTTRKTNPTETTQRLIQKEKEVDATHRRFAASLRSSPVDSIDHHRQTPRSSISSRGTYRRDLREGSHESTVPSETSRISSGTVTRHSPSKSVGKTVVTKQTVVKTRNVNGSNETIDLTPQRILKSPSPSKTVTTTTTKTTTTRKTPTEVPKPDNQNIKAAENTFPINEPLTITKSRFTATDASFPRNAVVEEPCIKKNFYKVGPSDKTDNSVDEKSPHSPAPSNHLHRTHPKSKSPVRDDNPDNFDEPSHQPLSSSVIEPRKTNRAPSEPRSSGPKNISHPKEPSVERRTVVRETTFEKPDWQNSIIDKTEPRFPVKNDYPLQQKPRSYPSPKNDRCVEENTTEISTSKVIWKNDDYHNYPEKPIDHVTKTPEIKTPITKTDLKDIHVRNVPSKTTKITTTSMKIENEHPVEKKHYPGEPVDRKPINKKPIETERDKKGYNKSPSPTRRPSDIKAKTISTTRTIEKNLKQNSFSSEDDLTDTNITRKTDLTPADKEGVRRPNRKTIDTTSTTTKITSKKSVEHKVPLNEDEKLIESPVGSDDNRKPLWKTSDTSYNTTTITSKSSRKPKPHIVEEIPVGEKRSPRKPSQPFDSDAKSSRKTADIKASFVTTNQTITSKTNRKDNIISDRRTSKKSPEPSDNDDNQSPTRKAPNVFKVAKDRSRQTEGKSVEPIERYPLRKPSVPAHSEYNRSPTRETATITSNRTTDKYLLNKDDEFTTRKVNKSPTSHKHSAPVDSDDNRSPTRNTSDVKISKISTITTDIATKDKTTSAPRKPIADKSPTRKLPNYKTSSQASTMVVYNKTHTNKAPISTEPLEPECSEDDESRKIVDINISSTTTRPSDESDEDLKPVGKITKSDADVTFTSTVTNIIPKYVKPQEPTQHNQTESVKIQELFKRTDKNKVTENINEDFMSIERGENENTDGAFISKNIEKAPTSPSYKKKGVTSRETFEERCRQILGMENDGDTQGSYQKRTSPEKEVPNEPYKKEKSPDTIFEVKIEDCDDDEPNYLNNIKNVVKARKTESSSLTMDKPKKPMRNENELEEVECLRTEKVVPFAPHKIKKETKSVPESRAPRIKPEPLQTKEFLLPDSSSSSEPESPNTYMEIDSENDSFIFKDTSLVEEERQTVSKSFRNSSPETTTRISPERKSSPQRSSPTRSPNRKPVEPNSQTREKPTSQKHTSESTIQINTSQQVKTSKTKSATKPLAESPKRTELDDINKMTVTTEKHSIVKKDGVLPKHKSKPSSEVKPRKEHLERITSQSTTIKNQRKSSADSPTPTIKERLRSSPRNKRPSSDETDKNSSPDASPTRFTERRRSSNISVHTEIIIDHTSPKSPQTSRKTLEKQKSPSKLPEEKIENGAITSTPKPFRRLPVTERKESAPVHNVTHKEKDVKMTRSTSEKIMKVTGKPTKKPDLSSLSPTPTTKTERRPNKCFTTKTINLTTSDKLINSEDMENVIIDIQHAKSSREPSPDKIVPTPVPANLDTGKPRYPDVVQEPEDEPRKKPVIKNIPIYEEETNGYVNCHISEVNIDKTSKLIDFDEEDILDNPTIEAPKSLDYTSIDKPDDDCLLSVHEKVSKFIHTAEEVKKPKASSPFNRELDATPHVPDNDDCLLTVDEKVNKFIKTAEKITQPITPIRDIERPRYEDLDEDIRQDDCTLSVSQKVNKFINSAEKLAPTAPQKSPLLVARIERTISKQSEPEYPESISDDETLVPFSENHTIEIEKKRQKDILSRPSVFDKNIISDHKTHAEVTTIQNRDDIIADDEIVPMTKEHTTQIELKRQKDILSRPSAFESPKQKRPIGSMTPNREGTVKQTDAKIKKSSHHNQEVKETIVERKPIKTVPAQPQTTGRKSPTKPNTFTVATTRTRFEMQDSKKSTPSAYSPQRTQQRNMQSPTGPKTKTPNEGLKTPQQELNEFDHQTTESETELTSTNQRRSSAKTKDTLVVEFGRVSPTKTGDITHHITSQGTYTKPKNTSHSPTTNDIKSTKTNVTKVTQRTMKHFSPSETSDNEQVETILESPKQVKSSPVTVGRSRVTADTVAARRNIFEKNIASKPHTPSTPSPTGRRPSYMDHTKSSLEHIRRDSLEVNKTNYSRKSLVEDETHYERRPNVAVTFDVPHKPHHTPEDIDIESIMDLDVLEHLLETVTSYELRRRIRCQIRLVKKNMLNTEIIDKKTSETKTSTSISSTHKSSTYSSKVHHEETDTITGGVDHNIPCERSSSPKRTPKITKGVPYGNEKSPTQSPHPLHSELRSVTGSKLSSVPSNRSESPNYPAMGQSSDHIPRAPNQRNYSPEQRPKNETMKEVRRTSDSRTAKREEYTHSEHYSEQFLSSSTEHSPERDNRKQRSYSPLSKPTGKPHTNLPRERSRSPESKSKPVTHSTRNRSPDDKLKKRPISPQTKTAKQHEESTFTVSKVANVRVAQSPDRKSNKPKVDEKAPIWVDRKNVLKNQGSTTVRKTTMTPTTKTTSATKTTTTRSMNQSKTRNMEEDSITSSYGIGPTDENGLPLFGIKALKKKKTTQPCEATEEVTGYVIEEKYYSDSKTKPTVERKEYIYSTNSDELEEMKKSVEKTQKAVSDDVNVIRKFEKIEKDYLQNEPKQISSGSEEFDAATTKYVRRGSVKELSEKFIRKESSQSITEKSNGYPKAGLILRSSQRGTTPEAAELYETTTERYTKSSGNYRPTTADTDDDDRNVELRYTRRMTTASDNDEHERESMECEVRTKSTKMSTRSFLNSSDETKIVKDVDDVLERMRNADNVVEVGDTAEDREARSLLNKFLGASVIMKGVEGVLPPTTKQTTTTTITKTCFADDGNDSDHLRNQAVKTTRVTKTTKSGNSSSPVTRTTCDIEEIWDEEILKELLEQATTYEERRKIRARLRELMAEREEKKNLNSGEKTENVVEEDETSTSTEYEEIIEEVTDYSDAEAELDDDDAKTKELTPTNCEQKEVNTIDKSANNVECKEKELEQEKLKQEKENAKKLEKKTEETVEVAAKVVAAESVSQNKSECKSITEASKSVQSIDTADSSVDKGESSPVHDKLQANAKKPPKAKLAAIQSRQPNQLTVHSNLDCKADAVHASCSSESSNLCSVSNNKKHKNICIQKDIDYDTHTNKTNTQIINKTAKPQTLTDENVNVNKNAPTPNINTTDTDPPEQSLSQSESKAETTMTKKSLSVTSKANANSSVKCGAKPLDRLSVPSKEDSGTESGEDLRLIAAGLRDSLHLQSDTNLIQEVTATLSRLESSLKEGKELPVDSSKREALLALVARLQTGLSAPDASVADVDDGSGNLDETSSPEADAHRSSRQRFARRRNRNSRHTVGVSREELADARRYMEDMLLMDNISNCTTPDSSTNAVTPPQWFPIEKNPSSGAILMTNQQQSTLLRPKQFVPNTLKSSTECLNGGENQSVQLREGQKAKRPLSGNYTVSFGPEPSTVSDSQNHQNQIQDEPFDERSNGNNSPDSGNKFNRFSNKKSLLKRANTIDIPKSKRYNPDFDTDSETEDKGPRIGLKRTVQVNVKHKVRSVVPPFEPKTENDHKFLAFINKQSAKPGLGWAGSRSVSNWTNKFGNLKHTFEVGAAAQATTGKPPQAPGHVPHSTAKNYWQKQVAQNSDYSQMQQTSQVSQQQIQRNQHEVIERQRRAERERVERERIERDRQERQRLERERQERDRLEREFYEREISERERLAAAKHAAMPSMSTVPKPSPVNQFIHAPQSVFRPVENCEMQRHNVFKPIPQLPQKINTWQPPSTIINKAPNSAPAQISSSSPQFLTPKQSVNASPSSTTSSPVVLPWVAKPAVDNSDFRKKATTFEERSLNDNRETSYLQRHNSLRAPKTNQIQMDDYRKRPSLPNTADPYQGKFSHYASQHQIYATPAMDVYAPPPPTNVSFTYADLNRTGNYKSYPCLPSAVETSMSMEYARSREDSLTDPKAMPLVLTSTNPAYVPGENIQQSYNNLPPAPLQFDYVSPMDSAPTSPSIMTMQQTDYTDDDIDSDNLLEYRVESKVMRKPQSQTAVTVRDRRTAHASDDEVFGKNSRAANNLLHTMRHLGNIGNNAKPKKEAVKKPESPKICLSPDGRAYQAPLVEPLFPQVTKFETNREPIYAKNNGKHSTSMKYQKPRTYTPPIPLQTDRSLQLARNQEQAYREQPQYTGNVLQQNTSKLSPQAYTGHIETPPNSFSATSGQIYNQPDARIPPISAPPAPYVSETKTAYVVTYPTEDPQEEIYRKSHPTNLPLQRQRNFSENSTTSSSLSHNLPSPSISWTTNPMNTDDSPVSEHKSSKLLEQHINGTIQNKPTVAPKPTTPSTHFVPSTPPQIYQNQNHHQPQPQPQTQTRQQHQVPPQQYRVPQQQQPTPAQAKTTVSTQQTVQERQYQTSKTQPTPKLSTRSHTTTASSKSFESNYQSSQSSSLKRQKNVDAGSTPLQIQNRVLSQQTLVSNKQRQFEQQQELDELRRKSLGNVFDMQQQQRKSALNVESHRVITQEYKSSAPPDTPDIVKSSLPKDDMPILKKFGPPQRHHYMPNSYQSPSSNTQTRTQKFESSRKVVKSEVVQHSSLTKKPSIVEIPATPQPGEDDLIPRNIVFNNINAFTSMSRRIEDEHPLMNNSPRQNRLSKSDSWNQIVQMQNQSNAALPPASPKFGSTGNELRRTKSGHSLNVRMYEAGIDKAAVSEKQRTVEAYFSGKKSPNQFVTGESNDLKTATTTALMSTPAGTKKSTINRIKTSEKVSASRKSLITLTGSGPGSSLTRSATMPHIANVNLLDESNVEDAFEQLIMAQQPQQQTTTKKTETKEQDGAIVTTTTKVTTRTVSGTGTAPKNVSPFAKFKQLDKQNSLQSQKSPTTPTTPGSSATPTGSTRIFQFTDPALNARAATVKDQLLQWCQSKTSEYENVEITNFSTCWTDGLAFCALIHHFLPDAFDYSKLTPKNRRHNFELAFTVADEKAGIAPLLDVEDMVVMKRPDWKCVFVYVQSIYRRFRNCQ